MAEAPSSSHPEGQNDASHPNRRDFLKEAALIFPFAAALNGVAAEAQEKPSHTVGLDAKFIGKGGPHIPQRIQVDLESGEDNRSSMERDVRPGQQGIIELTLTKGRHTIDVRPLVTRSGAERAELSSMNPEVGFTTYRVPDKKGGFVRMESGATITVDGDREIPIGIEPAIELKNIVFLKTGEKSGLNVRRSALVLPPDETDKEKRKGMLRIAHEESAENFPYTVNVFKIEQKDGATAVTRVHSIISNGGSLPEEKEIQLDPGTYVFMVTPNRPHYNQSSLVTLKGGTKELNARQLQFLGTPVVVKAGQEVIVTVEQHNKPYNTTVGEFSAKDGGPTVRMLMIFPRGYPAMDDLDKPKQDTFERAVQKSDLLTLHMKGREKFVKEQVDTVMETIFDPAKQNTYEWRKSVILYSRPNATGNSSDAVRGMSIKEFGALGDDEKAMHKTIVRARLTEFVTQLFEENMQQPYRSENAAALLQMARGHLKDDAIPVLPRHMDKNEAVDRFGARYIDMLKKRE